MNLVDILRARAHERPGKMALRREKWATGWTPFKTLDKRSSHIAALLKAAGLRGGDGERMGDVVLILQPVSIDLYVVLLAVLRARLTAMFVDPGAGRAGIEAACRLIPPRAMVGNTKACCYRLLSPTLRRIPVALTTGLIGGIARRLGGPRQMLADEPTQDETPALITFTSGSTGPPKVAVRTHGFLLAQHRALTPGLDLRKGDYVATTFPVFVLSHLASGAATLLAPEPSPGAMESSGGNITVIDAAPAWCERLVEACRRKHRKLESVRHVVVGGGPVFPRLIDALEECAPNARVTILYGSTEAEPIAHIDRESMSADDLREMRSGRGLLVGPPVEGISLRVLDGEIVVSGAHVLSGYYQGVRDEETKFRVDGVVWHRTGDAGFLDERGRVWLLGRLSARIRDAKGELFPFQVEAAASEQPGVSRAALLARNGQRVLLVELEKGMRDAVLQQLRSRLGWANLDRVVECDRIPTDRRHHSKVDYAALENVAID